MTAKKSLSMVEVLVLVLNLKVAGPTSTMVPVRPNPSLKRTLTSLPLWGKISFLSIYNHSP